MHPLAPLIKDLTIILGIAGLVTILFQKIRQPVVLGYLIAGIIIGPYTPPYPLVSDVSEIKVLAELGVIFLMFSLGLDFNFHKLTRVGFSASMTGLFEVIGMLLIGFMAGKIMHWPFFDSLFLAAALSISSTTIIIKTFDELKLKQKRFAELVFGILVVEDLLAVLLLVALSIIVSTSNVFTTEILVAAFKLILVVGSWFLIGYFFVPTFLRKVMHYISDETLTIITIALCLTLVCIAAYFHYSTALGAFIMGSILAETTESRRIENLILPIRDIFAAVFFVSMGMLIDPKIIWSHWPLVLYLTVITILGKIIISSIGAFLTGQSINTSLRVGFSLGQIGEFSFIIVGLGLALNVINPSLSAIIVAISGITAFTTPYLIRASETLSQGFDKKISPRVKYFLESYSAWLYNTRMDRKHHPDYYKAIIRFAINAIVIAIVFTACEQLLAPELTHLFTQTWLIKLISWLVAVIISLPFIWAMLFKFKKTSGIKLLKFSPLMAFSWLIVLAEFCIFTLAYFNTWIITLILFVILLGFLVLLYKQLEKSYHWLEKKLITNISKLEQFSHIQFEALAPWDTHLVKMDLSSKSLLIGKTFAECQLRQNYGINIVGIYRNDKTILAPNGKQQFIPGDNLIVLGNDAQIEQFKQVAEKDIVTENEISLENFKLKSIHLKKNNPLIGKTIRNSKIRAKTSGLVVGLERKGIRILNPDSSTVLEKDDVLFIIGKEKFLENMG